MANTAYSTLLKLDVSKAIAELKKFEKIKEQALKTSKFAFKINTDKAKKSIKALEKVSKSTGGKSGGSFSSGFKGSTNLQSKKIFQSVERVAKNSGKNSGLSFGKLFTANLSSFLTGSAIIGVFNGLTNSITNFSKNAFTNLVDVEEQMANIQKTTGLAGKELESLQTDIFKEIGRNTRTANSNLLKIVETGGRLGISEKKDLVPFTKAINKITVALGDEFVGGGQEAIETVGKLAESFNELKGLPIDKSLDKIGSAINEVTSNSKAKGGNLSNFLSRIGQLPDAIKPSLSSTVALGAVLEGANVSSEIAASGVSRVIKSASGNLGGFANQMSITADEAKKLLNTDPGQFVVKFSESLKGLDGEELEGTLKTLKIGTMESLKVVGALGGRTDEFGKLQKIANDQIQNATSLTDEYNIKNNTLLANIGKLSNRFGEFQFKVGKFGKALFSNVPFLDRFSSKLVKLSDSILNLDFQKAGADLGKKLDKTVSIIFDKLKQVFSNTLFSNLNIDGIKNIFDSIKSAIDNVDFSSLTKTLGTLAGDTLILVLDHITNFSNILIGLAQQVDIQTFFEGLKSTFEILTNEILPGLLPLVESLFNLTMNFFQTVGNIALPVIDAIINGFNFLGTNIFPILADVFTNTLSPAFENLFNSLGGLLNNILPVLKFLGFVIGGIVVGAIVIFIGVLTASFVVFAEVISFIAKVVTAFVGLANKIIEFTTNSFQAITGFVTNTINKFNELVTGTTAKATELKDGVIGKFTELKEGGSAKFTELKTGVIEIITSFIFDILAKLGEFASGVGEAFTTAKNSAVEAMNPLQTDVLTMITTLSSKVLDSAKSIGINMAQGMISGIQSKITDVANKAAEMARKALDSAKQALGIHSPSTKVRDQVSKNFVLGFPAGIKKYGALAFNAVKKFSVDSLNTANNALSNDLGFNRLSNSDIPKPSSSFSGVNNNSNVTNNNQKSVTQNNSITIQTNQAKDTADAIIQRLNLITT